MLAYASTLRAPLPRAALELLLSGWRVSNAQRGITGLLLLHGTACFQVLEGFPDAIDALYARIKIDPRHGEVVRLLNWHTDRRRFGDWSMKLARASPTELSVLPGLEHFETLGGFQQLGLENAVMLVEMLSEAYWKRMIG